MVFVQLVRMQQVIEKIRQPAEENCRKVNQMTPKKEICPKCQSEIKQLKHSILCNCGLRLKSIKAIVS